MNNYDDFEENQYDSLTEEMESPFAGVNQQSPTIDSAAIANASANAINGPNGQELCRTIRYAIGVIGIMGLTWLYESGRK